LLRPDLYDRCDDSQWANKLTREWSGGLYVVGFSLPVTDALLRNKAAEVKAA